MINMANTGPASRRLSKFTHVGERSVITASNSNALPGDEFRLFEKAVANHCLQGIQP